MRSVLSKIFVILTVLSGIIVFSFSGVCAQDVSVEIELTPRVMVLGSPGQLLITVNGSQEVDPIELPAIDGFDADYLGPSTRVSIVNGKYSSSKTFAYSLLPLKEGTFNIPPLNVVISGRTYRTKPVAVQVAASGTRSRTSFPNQPASLEDQLFIVLEASKKEVYLNERIDLKVRLFVAGLAIQDVQYPELDNIGFSIGDYDRPPRQYQQALDGVRYEVVEFRTDIYPTRTGELHLGPAMIQCNLLVKSPDGPARFGGRHSIFDDDFFNSFFNRAQKRPVSLQSEEVTINVLEPPKEGRP